MDLEHTDSEGSAAVARRRLLRAGVGGVALSLLPFLSRRASATTPDTAPTTSAPGDAEPAATTTTAPPQRPTTGDIPLLTFSQSLEMVAVQRYTAALDATEWSSEQALVLGTMREGHLGYVNSLSGLLGREGLTAPDPAVEEAIPGFGSSVEAILAAASELESTAVASHLEVIGELQGTNAAGLLAAVVIVEAANGTVLASLMGETDFDSLLVVDEAQALRPTASEG